MSKLTTWLIFLIHFYSCTNAIEKRAANVYGNNRFYYTSLQKDGEFYANLPFQVEFSSSASTIIWAESSGRCVFSNLVSTAIGSFSSLPATPINITCSEAGSYSFTVTRNNDATTTDTFYVTLKTSSLLWYIALVDPLQPTVSTISAEKSRSDLKLRTWIYDPLNQNQQEDTRVINCTIYSKSFINKKSQSITASFHYLGEYPIFLFSKSQIVISNTTYNSNGNYWESIVSTNDNPGSIPVKIISQGITSWGKSVTEKQTSISIAKLPKIVDFVQNLPSSASANTYLKYYPDVFASSNFVALSSSWGTESFVIGNLETKLFDKYQLNGNLNLGGNILEVISTKNGLVFLTSSGVAYFENGTTKLSTGLTGVSLNRLKSVDYYDSTFTGNSVFNSMVIGWNGNDKSTSANAFVKFYISVDSGKSFTTFDVNVSQNSVAAGGFIQSASIQQSYSNIAILIRDSNGFDRIALLDPITKVFSNGYIDSSASELGNGVKASTPSTTATTSGILYLWGDALHYSIDGGKTHLAINLLSRDASISGANLGITEFLLSLVVKDGFFAVLTSTNRMFLGKSGSSYAYEISSGLSTTQIAKIGFDSSAKLYVVTATSSPLVVLKTLAWKSEIINPRASSGTASTLKCPYSIWDIYGVQEYYMDMNEAISITSTLVSPFSTKNIITISNPNTVKLTSNVTRWNPWEMTDIIFVEESTVSFKVTSQSITGRTDILIQPKYEEPSCLKSEQVIAVQVGCPPTKTMINYIPNSYVNSPSPTPRIHHDRYTTTAYPAYSKAATPTGLPTSSACVDTPFTISSGKWYNRTTNEIGAYDKVVSSYCSKFGSPQKVYYGNLFRPYFAIYNGDKFIKYVNADVGLLEVNGRTSYSFNSTASTVGCRSETFSLKTSSFPSNYTKCYDKSQPYSISSSGLQKEYEIINGTNGNAIMWKDYVDGIYLFQAQVLDPTYSYCTLTAYFAVEVVGAPSGGFWQVFIVIICNLIAFLLLGISYFWYSQGRKRIFDQVEKEKAD